MGRKKKQRLLILLLGLYLMATSFGCAYLYENIKSESYRIALWFAIGFHILAVYVAIAHWGIEGNDD